MKNFYKAVLIAIVFLIFLGLKYPLATMLSLKKISDYPVLRLDFYGTNPFLPKNAKELKRMIKMFYPSATKRRNDIYCSLIASKSNNGTIYGRNFDWYKAVPVVVVSHAIEGKRYASISLTDGVYLSVKGDCGLMDKINAAGAYISPFDGMNEKGLFISIALVKQEKVPQDSKKETISSVLMVRKILDKAATVKEAIDIVNSYNIDFFPGPHVHFLIGDANGDGAIVEFTSKGVKVIEKKDPVFATNFTFYDKAEDADLDSLCWRYKTIDEFFKQNEKADFNSMLSLLKSVAQIGDKAFVTKWGEKLTTQWSAVYMPKGLLKVCFGGDYNKVFTFKIEK
ncbi:choloylglycine hydrolase [Thermotomaculum hydrothermale]|uniref:Choloylglycine hydrolase n=1 Tax=Thermotomaculum hydrothermale TaxID=981385 RepID=A0A7R6PTT4_9BACT|nr:C45 family autoproteolytic acyltransferase/hydolase [Thermotomaculum hydrothermale]BBB32532.1 choloylglycine hydrolase [Thermotomaculum hydrothermale]